MLSCLSVTPWTLAHQAPLSMWSFQARILEWVAMPTPRGSSQPGDQTQVSCIVGRFFTIWATREAPHDMLFQPKSFPPWSTCVLCKIWCDRCCFLFIPCFFSHPLTFYFICAPRKWNIGHPTRILNLQAYFLSVFLISQWVKMLSVLSTHSQCHHYLPQSFLIAHFHFFSLFFFKMAFPQSLVINLL